MRAFVYNNIPYVYYRYKCAFIGTYIVRGTHGINVFLYKYILCVRACARACVCVWCVYMCEIKVTIARIMILTQ